MKVLLILDLDLQVFRYEKEVMMEYFIILKKRRFI